VERFRVRRAIPGACDRRIERADADDLRQRDPLQPRIAEDDHARRGLAFDAEDAPFDRAVRTLDAHAAFLSNSNAVVNILDLHDLPRILDVALREFNELYRELNGALQLSAL